MTKVAVLTNAFREKTLIPGCIEQFRPFGLEHLVILPNISWNGALENDDTALVAVQNGAKVWQSHFGSAHEQFNTGLEELSDYSWVIICDTDERYTQEDIAFLLAHFEGNVLTGYDALKTDAWTVYWKTPDYIIVPEQTDYPLIAVRPSVRFDHIRRCNAEMTAWANVHMHHFSYVRSDEDMKKKVATFEASKEFDALEWYVNKWEPWTEDMEALHPVNPPQFHKAVYSPESCPEEIRKLI